MIAAKKMSAEKNVLLVNPPASTPLGMVCAATILIPPMGLAYLASMVRRAGYRPSILDMRAPGNGKARFIEEFERLRPRVVAFSVMTDFVTNALRLARIVKKLDPECWVVFGGPHPGYRAEEILHTGVVDVVAIKGDGEEVFREICDAAHDGEGGPRTTRPHRRRGLPGRRGDRPDAGTGPPDEPGPDPLARLGRPPARGLQRPARPLDPRLRRPLQVLLRGSGRRQPAAVPRHRSRHGRDRLSLRPRRAHAELQRRQLRLGAQAIGGALPGARGRFPGLRWTCETRVDTTSLDDLRLMAEAGCRSVHFGVESISKKTLDELGKRYHLDQVVERVALAAELGIKNFLTFVIGLPSETEEQIRDSFATALELKKKYKAICAFSILTPYPGSEYGDHPERYGITINSRNYDHYNTITSVISTRHLSQRQLQNLHCEFTMASMTASDSNGDALRLVERGFINELGRVTIVQDNFKFAPDYPGKLTPGKLTPEPLVEELSASAVS